MLVVALALAMAGSWQARLLQLDVSNDSIIPNDPVILEAYEESVATFGSDQLALVFAADPELFTPDKLNLLQQLSQSLKALEGVSRVDSLFTTSVIESSNGVLRTGPLIREIPESAGACLELRERARSNSLLAGRIISTDGNATLFGLVLEPEVMKDHRSARSFYLELKAILAEFDGAFHSLYQTGAPALRAEVSRQLMADQLLLIPLSALVLTLLIGRLLGSWQCAILPLFNSAVATAITLGLMALLGIPVNLLTYIVPALILIIGTTEDVHVIDDFREAMESGEDAPGAISMVGDRLGLTLLLTGLTTTLGFAATALNTLPILQQFGMAAAAAMLIRFMVAVTVLPATLGCLGKRPGIFRKQGGSGRVASGCLTGLQKIVGAAPQIKPVTAILIFTLLVIISIPLIRTIPVGNDLLSFLDEDSATVRHVHEVGEKLSGAQIIQLNLSGPEGFFRRAEGLQLLQAISTRIRQTGGVDSTLSLADYIAAINLIMHDNDPEAERVPENNALVAQYLLFFHRSDLRALISGNFSTASIQVRTSIHDSARINAAVDEWSYYLQGPAYAGQQHTITGKTVMAAAGIQQIIIGQAASLSVLGLLLLLIVAVIFLSFKASLLTVACNLLPALLLFVAMGLFGIPLNIGTCMVAAVTLGIVIDDTLHLTLRYNRNLRRLKEEVSALQATLSEEFRPVTTSSLALAGGFLVLGFSSFSPVAWFGWLSALVIITALIVDLALTPLLLANMKLITLWDVIGMRLRQQLLSQSPVFQGMSRWQAKKLVLLADMETHPAGTKVISEGESSDQMYVIIEGEMQVSRHSQQGPVTLKILQPGDVFGEIALVAKTVRTADVFAVTDIKVLTFSQDSLERLQRWNPFLSSRLFLNLSRILGMRLRETLGKMTPSPFNNSK